MTNLLKRLFWQGSPADRVISITTGIVSALALIASVLSAVSVIELSGDKMQSFALFGLAAVLLWILSESARRKEQDETHATLVAESQRLLGVAGDALPAVRQVAPDEVGPTLEAELRESSNWSFRGGSGRWLRKASLPAMARVRGQAAVVHLQLLDPRSEHLCQKYAKYRESQRSASDVRPDEGNPRTIQADILASFAALYWHAAGPSRIDARAVVLQSFSPLRIDIGDNALLVTVADKTEPGLLAERGSWFYTSICDEMAEAHRVGSGALSWTEPNLARPRAPTGEWVRAALLGLAVSFAGQEPTPLLDGFAADGLLDFDAIASRVLGNDE